MLFKSDHATTDSIVTKLCSFAIHRSKVAADFSVINELMARISSTSFDIIKAYVKDE